MFYSTSAGTQTLYIPQTTFELSDVSATTITFRREDDYNTLSGTCFVSSGVTYNQVTFELTTSASTQNLSGGTYYLQTGDYMFTINNSYSNLLRVGYDVNNQQVEYIAYNN